jgi:hypothetical protein
MFFSTICCPVQCVHSSSLSEQKLECHQLLTLLTTLACDVRWRTELLTSADGQNFSVDDRVMTDRTWALTIERWRMIERWRTELERWRLSDDGQNFNVDDWAMTDDRAMTDRTSALTIERWWTELQFWRALTGRTWTMANPPAEHHNIN